MKRQSQQSFLLTSIEQARYTLDNPELAKLEKQATDGFLQSVKHGNLGGSLLCGGVLWLCMTVRMAKTQHSG